MIHHHHSSIASSLVARLQAATTNLIRGPQQTTSSPFIVASGFSLPYTAADGSTSVTRIDATGQLTTTTSNPNNSSGASNAVNLFA